MKSKCSSKYACYLVGGRYDEWNTYIEVNRHAKKVNIERMIKLNKVCFEYIPDQVDVDTGLLVAKYFFTLLIYGYNSIFLI